MKIVNLCLKFVAFILVGLGIVLPLSLGILVPYGLIVG